jgi:hypothetical protein
VWMIHFWIVENHYPDRVMRQFDLFQQVPPPAPIDYQQVLTYQEVVNDRMSIRHRTSPSCLSRSCDRTTMPSTIRTWGDIIRERWLQYGTE